MNSRIFVTAVTILLAFATYSADENAPRTDQEFATKMAQGGMCGVQASEMAQRKSLNADVKTFADMMVSQHSKANAELTALAGKKGWTLPQALDDKHQGKITILQAAAQGTTFDQEYASLMVKAHNKSADLFRSASITAQDADLKAFSAKTLAMIEQHKAHATEVATAVGAPPTTSPVKASFSEVQRDAQGETGTTTTTQESQRQTNRAPNEGTVIESNTPATTDTTQDATNQTNRAQQPNANQPTTQGTNQQSGTPNTTQDATNQTNRARNQAPGTTQPGTQSTTQDDTREE